MHDNRILLSLPHMGGSEMKWINEAFADNWVVPLGPNVDEFERRLSAVCAGRRTAALSAGTAAIHLGLVMAGVKPGDEVLCQSLTFSASANPIAYCGASPIFVGSDEQTWNMAPHLLRSAIEDRLRITGKVPKAMIPVWLYGRPPRMHEIMEIAREYGITVVEDAAEALGSTLDDRPAGTFGDYGALSFNGNKIITTSGGGALICPDDEAAARVKFYATQAREDRPYYYHKVIGYNYRMSNVCAGIGCGQMEVLADRVERRRAIHDIYADRLGRLSVLTVTGEPLPGARSNHWLTTVTLHPELTPLTPDDLRRALAAESVEARLLWRPMHMQPVFASAPVYTDGVEEKLFARGLCLPSGSILTDEQIHRVCDIVERVTSDPEKHRSR